MKLLFQTLAGIGLFLLAAAALTYVQSAYFVAHAQLATGTVVAFSISKDPDTSASSYCPEVRYQTQSGQTVNFGANTCSSPAAYQVGDPIELYYDPQNPQAAQIKSFAAQYLVSTSLVISGLPLALAGLLGLFLQKKRQGRDTSV